MARSFLSRLWNLSSSKKAGRPTSRSRRLHLESLEHRELFAVLFDSNFEDHGKVLTSVPNVNLESVVGMAQQKDRKIVVVGSVYGDSGVVLARYEPDGNLDVTFGNGGLVNTGFIGVQSDTVADVAIQKDGKIVIVGTDFFNGQFAFMVARFNSNGQFDPTFNGTGVTFTPITTEARATSVAIQSDGKIVAGGYAAQDGGRYDFAAVRYTTTGALDTTFSGDGIVTSPYSSASSLAKQVLIQTDGKIILAGESGAPLAGHTGITAMRFTAAGVLDPTFSGDGIVIIGSQEFPDTCHSAALQTDGKLLLVGDTTVNSSNVEATVVRLNTNGTLDTNFSGDGIATAGYSAGIDSGLDVVQRSDGKILVSGGSVIAGNPYSTLYQFTAAGVLDKTFDGDGRRSSQFAAAGFTKILTLPSGKFLAAGLAVQNGNGAFALSRFIETRPVITSFVVPTRATLNQRVHLSGLASDPNQSSATLKYTWTITGPRGFKVTLVGKNANFVASRKGTLTVTLTVLDEEGLTASLTDKIAVA